jgi:excisionase family DNA binding protein
MIRIFLLLSIAVALLSLESHTTSFALYAAPAAVMAVAASIDPIFVSVAVAAEMLATSRSEIYQKLARGELDAVKDGSRTKVTYESVRRVASALPKASVRLYVPRAQRAAAHASKPPSKA